MKEKGQEAGRYSSVRHKDTEEGKKRGLKKICKEESRREGYVLSRVKGRKSLCLYWVHTGNELASRSGTLRSTHWQCPCCGRPWSGEDRQSSAPNFEPAHCPCALCPGTQQANLNKNEKGHTHTRPSAELGWGAFSEWRHRGQSVHRTHRKWRSSAPSPGPMVEFLHPKSLDPCPTQHASPGQQGTVLGVRSLWILFYF